MPAKRPLPTDAESVAARNAHRAEYDAAPSDALFPVAAVATVACTTEKTLETWRSVGRGPAWVHVGRNIRYRRRDVDAWLARSDRAEEPPPPPDRIDRPPVSVTAKKAAPAPSRTPKKGGR